jgi:hypothetical protein
MSGNRPSRPRPNRANAKTTWHAPAGSRKPGGSSGPQTWRIVMIVSTILVVLTSLGAAVALGAFSGNAGSAGSADAGAASTPTPRQSAQSQNSSVCLSSQNCSSGLPYAQPDFLAVAMPKLEAALHKSEAQIVGAMNNGTNPTQLAAQAGLSTAQWYQDESDAFTAGFNALIAKNELTVPSLSSHPEITTPQQYRDYMQSSIKTQGADFELALALGVNPMQAGIMPGGE